MYKYCVGLALLLPLSGMILMETGSYGLSVGLTGYPNGVSLAYSCYLLVVLIAAVVIARLPPRRPPPAAIADQSGDTWFMLWTALAVNLLFLFILLIPMGAYRVLLGQVTKQDFRAGLGGAGAAAYLMSRFLIPAVLAFSVAKYLSTANRRGLRLPLWLGFGVAMATGACWGFKSTPVLMVLPAVCIVFWRAKFRHIMAIGVVAVLMIGAGFFLFEGTEDSTLLAAAGFLAMRATVLTGDVPWMLWEQYRNHVRFPDYAITLLPVIGDRAFTALTGLGRDDRYQWFYHHYDLLLTYMVGYPPDDVGGISVTGTAFGEGLVALGSPGFLVFALLAGVLVGGLYRILDRAISGRQAILSALGAAYLFTVLIPWIVGGSVLQLVHISVVVGLLSAYLLLRFIEVFRFFPARTRLARP